MKKLSLLVVFIALGTIALNAQVELKGLIGTNFSSLTKPPDGYSFGAKAGYQFGVGVLIGDKFYVEPGLQFVRRTKTITSETTEFDFGQNSIKIPVYAGYHLLGHESGPVALRLLPDRWFPYLGKSPRERTRSARTISRIRFGWQMSVWDWTFCSCSLN